LKAIAQDEEFEKEKPSFDEGRSKVAAKMTEVADDEGKAKPSDEAGAE
jgi:hypothetical protein